VGIASDDELTTDEEEDGSDNDREWDNEDEGCGGLKFIQEGVFELRIRIDQTLDQRRFLTRTQQQELR